MSTHVKEGMTPVQSEYVSWLAKHWLPGMLAAGAAVRGVSGLGELVSSNLAKPPQAPEPIMLNIPYKAPSIAGAEEEDEDERLPRARRLPMSKLGSIIKRAWPDYFGADATNAYDIPAAWPATTVGGGLAALGGYKLMDKLMQRRKDQMREDETQQAREEYEKALLSQFTPVPHTKIKTVPLREPVVSKMASAVLSEDTVKALIEKTAGSDTRLGKLAERLDKLADKIATEKRSWSMNPLDLVPDDWKAKGTGMYSVIAPGLALGSGLGTYALTRQAQGDDEMDALRRQQEERWLRRPPSVYANLTPVDEHGHPIRPGTRSWQQRFGQEQMKKKLLGTTLPSDDIEDSTKTASADDINSKAAAFVKQFLGG